MSTTAGCFAITYAYCKIQSLRGYCLSYRIHTPSAALFKVEYNKDYAFIDDIFLHVGIRSCSALVLCQFRIVCVNVGARYLSFEILQTQAFCLEGWSTKIARG